jgi:hypothetical protein
VGDCAYAKGSSGEVLGMISPKAVPQNGDPLTVRKSDIVFLFLSLTSCKGDNLKRSHLLQSFRAAVEHLMADLKRWAGLEDIPAAEVVKFTQRLDVVISLHNLNVLVKAGVVDAIPGRLPRNLEYGDPLTLPSVGVQKRGPKTDTKVVKDFIEYLKGEVLPLRRALELNGVGSRFTPKVRTRGASLCASGYVLQVAIGMDGADAWTIKFAVGSSYADGRYVGYCLMTKGNPIVRTVCSCTVG